MAHGLPDRQLRPKTLWLRSRRAEHQESEMSMSRPMRLFLAGSHFFSSRYAALRARVLRGSRFKAARVVIEEERTLPAAPDKVFPLLCPTREYEWIENWKCQIVYSDSGYAEVNCIFVNLTTYETWLFTRYEPEHYLFEVAIFAGHLVLKVDLALVESVNQRTIARMRCTATALDRLGNWFIQRSARERLTARMKNLFSQLEHYLVAGEMLVAGRRN